MDRVAAVALFIRIVETRSLSKAAVDFGIAHANATKAGAAVEQRLGARLQLPTQEIIAVFPSPKWCQAR